jgi:hypothetical protein
MLFVDEARAMLMDDLQRDLELATEYCDRHPAEASGASLDPSPSPVIEAYFVRNLGLHEERLQALVENPHKVRVLLSCASMVEQSATAKAILRLADADDLESPLIRIGRLADGPLEVTLRPEAGTLADLLRDRFGDKVRVALGSA